MLKLELCVFIADLNCHLTSSPKLTDITSVMRSIRTAMRRTLPVLAKKRPKDKK